MKKLPLVAAAAAGYVLGSRAGRERYEQLRRGARRVADDPRVQAASTRAQEKVREGVATATSAAVDRVRP